MKNTNKFILLFALLLGILVFTCNFSYAQTEPVKSEEELTAAISSAEDGAVIELANSIELSTPLEITDKQITIDGKGNTISRNTSSWHTTSANGSLITAGSAGEKAAKVTLKNLTLTNAEKYGAQAYNKGYLVLDNVTIYGCVYGGVISNAGIVEVVNLHLGQNGQYENNGIELAKSEALKDNDNDPKLIMNGTLTSTEDVNVIYIAINDSLASFDVENKPGTVNKVFASGNKLVVTDENNNVIYESNETDKVEISGTEFVPNPTVTIYLMDAVTTISVPKGTKLTNEGLMENIDLITLGYRNYTIEGFYENSDYTTAFNFDNPITGDTTIYAKLVSTLTPEPAQDVTPKTGFNYNISIAFLIIALSAISIVILKKKEN